MREAKSRLVRIVAGPEGPVVDPTGPGRGAYVHPSDECIAAALERRGLARSLRTGVGLGGAARLGEVIRERRQSERAAREGS